MNKYLFRYGFEKNKEIAYKVFTSGSFKLAGPNGESSTPIKISMIIEQRVEDCSEDNAMVKVTIKKADAECDIPKESMPEVGKNYEIEMDTLGNCKWIGGKVGWQGSEHSMIRFPENEIEIGDTWVQKMEDNSNSQVPFYNRYRFNGRDRRNSELVIFSSEIYTGHPDEKGSCKIGSGSFTFNVVDKWVQDSDVRIEYKYLIPIPDNPGIILRAKTVLNVDMERC